MYFEIAITRQIFEHTNLPLLFCTHTDYLDELRCNLDKMKDKTAVDFNTMMTWGILR